MQQLEKIVYQISDLQKILGLSRSSVSTLIYLGRIKSIKVGRRVLIPHWALQEFLQLAPVQR